MAKFRSASKGDFDISMLGDVQLQKNLSELERAIQRKIVMKGARAAIMHVFPKMKAKVPPGRVTGRMKDTMKVKAGKLFRRTRVAMNIYTGTREELNLDPEQTSYYPAHVELGTRLRSAKSFIRAPFANARNDMIKILGDVIGDEIIKTVRGMRIR